MKKVTVFDCLMEKDFQELMEKDSQEMSEVVKEVREMRRKISEEFDHDLGKFIAHCQELEKEWRKSGEYQFVNSEQAHDESKSAESVKVEAAD